MNNQVIICKNKECCLPFFKTRKHSKTRKFCSRDCYRYVMQQTGAKEYTRIWYNGKREYLHRVIYMQATGETLTHNDIIHHINENKKDNRLENLEKLSGRAAHLYKHDYHKKHKEIVFDSEFPF